MKVVYSKTLIIRCITSEEWWGFNVFRGLAHTAIK